MSLTLFDPVGSSLRTCLLSELVERTGYSGTWKESATPAGRLWWVLETWEPRTGASGYSSWPTPAAGNDHWSGHPSEWGGSHARARLAAWQTPTSGNMERDCDYTRDGGDPNKPRATLTGQAKEWATPTATPYGSNQGGADELLLTGQARQESSSTPGKPRGSLNSRWVGQLMGFPPDWCELPTDTLSALTATRSSRRSPKSSAEP